LGEAGVRGEAVVPHPVAGVPAEEALLPAAGVAVVHPPPGRCTASTARLVS